ncbi:MAG: RdgB/HAM1 family non-canonical purine NTP pyrophosphatase [Planctomycetota bacterium]|nr:RdgB/HAM1 family non-canonical purine NTP pyrophosphatase [Planctomycetota bacterium]
MTHRILFATSNPHKVEEVVAVLELVGVEVISLANLASEFPEPEETGETFAENARIKAVAYAAMCGMHALADDSGLSVDALGGAPGVQSARYAGVGTTRAERDAANNAKLLAALTGVPEGQRSARFVCAMCLAAPDGSILAEAEGTFEGAIGFAPRGSNGFGYDPLLELPGEGRTSAELSPQEKNARSHRGAATRAMADSLRGLTANPDRVASQ